MTTYAEMQAHIAELQQQAEALRRQELSAVIADIKAKLAQYGLTVDDLRQALKASSLPAKYRHPKSGASWSGKGKQPLWLKQELAAGKSKEDFLI